jgi:hypothetical protein
MVELIIPQKRSAIDKIMQGLQVAQAIGGIKSDYEKGKLAQLQQEQAKKDLEAQKKLESGIFTPSQAKSLYEASADDKRAQLGKIEEKGADGQSTYKDFWYITPERLKQESSVANLNETEQKTRLESQYAQGRVRPADWDHNIAVYGSKNPGGGFRQAWDIIQNPDGTTKRVDVWLKPLRRQTLEDSMGVGSGSGFLPTTGPGGVKLPLITMKDLKTPEEKAGYRNAVQKLAEKGIPQNEIPYRISIEDVYAYNPKKLEADRKDISNKLKSYNELMPAIKNVDKLIGGIDGDKPIKGSADLRSALKVGMFGSLASRVGITDVEKLKQAAISKTPSESKSLWTALSGLKSDFNRLKSGLSLTASELAAAENALGVSEWADDAQLRQGIKTFLSAIKSGMQNVEAGYHDASIDNYVKNSKSVTTKDPIFERLNGNPRFVGNPGPGSKDGDKRDAAINFTEGG